MAARGFIPPYRSVDIAFTYPWPSDQAEAIIRAAEMGVTLPIDAIYHGAPATWECYVDSFGVYHTRGRSVLRGMLAPTGPPQPREEEVADGSHQ